AQVPVKRLLVDVNVALDAVLARSPHADAATRLWVAVEERRVSGLMPAHAVTTLHYLIDRARGRAVARRSVADILTVFGVAAVGGEVLGKACARNWPDFEDAVCAAAAAAAECDLIITRDPRGFRSSRIRAVHPAAALAMIDEASGPGRVAERARRRYTTR